jgi:hypothetical protein
MYVLLGGSRKIRGQNYPKGAVVEVSETLGNLMILNSVSKRSNEEEFEEYQIASNDYKKLNLDDLIGYANSLGIQVPNGVDKEDIYPLIEEKFKEEA